MPTSPPSAPAWRDAAARDDALRERLDLALAAHPAAGGAAADAEEQVRKMLTACSVEHGDWLYGPEMRRIDRERPWDRPAPEMVLYGEEA